MDERLYRQLATKLKALADETYDNPMGALEGLRKLRDEMIVYERSLFVEESIKEIKKHKPIVNFTNPGGRR
jgi:hypothetical protein